MVRSFFFLASTMALLTANNAVLATADANQVGFLRIVEKASEGNEERGIVSLTEKFMGSIASHHEAHKYVSEIKTIAKDKTTKQYTSALAKVDDVESKIKGAAGMEKATESVEKTKFYIWFKMNKIPDEITNAAEKAKYTSFIKITNLHKEAKRLAKEAKRLEKEAIPVAGAGGWGVGGI